MRSCVLWSCLGFRELGKLLHEPTMSLMIAETVVLLLIDNQEIDSKMSTRDIEGEWRAASYFLAKGPSASVQYLQKDVKAQLFALKTQALDGDCPPGQDGSMAMDPSLRIRQVSYIPLSEG